MGHIGMLGRRIAPPLLLCAMAAVPAAEPGAGNDYPTLARVEYVLDCIRSAGGEQENVYKCSCVIDRIAARLSYDEYVEYSTFSKYASQPGERGGIFRDTDEAKQKTRLYRELETGAFKACGLHVKPLY